MKEAELFSRTLELPDAEREAYLEEVFRDDHALKGIVEALLREHEQGDVLLDASPEGIYESLGGRGAGAEHEPPSAGESMCEDGTHVLLFGDYELEEEIARGAMGVVYRARQTSWPSR